MIQWIMRGLGYAPLTLLRSSQVETLRRVQEERATSHGLCLQLIRLRADMNRLQRKLGRARERNRAQHRELRAIKHVAVEGVAPGSHRGDCRCAECGYGL